MVPPRTPPYRRADLPGAEVSAISTVRHHLQSHVWQVRNPAEVYTRYTVHSDRLGAASNEARRFHGTSMRCNFGIDVTAPPCRDPACAVCTICAASFRLVHAGGGRLTAGFGALNGALRYGRGLYFSKVSTVDPCGLVIHFVVTTRFTTLGLVQVE